MEPGNVSFIYRLKLYALYSLWENEAALYIDNDLLYRGAL